MRELNRAKPIYPRSHPRDTSSSDPTLIDLVQLISCGCGTCLRRAPGSVRGVGGDGHGRLAGSGGPDGARITMYTSLTASNTRTYLRLETVRL